tara:strand:+ start:1272 stop:1592 length:321 start_codon:yes stop_codon:yes gene_type:complete
LRSCAKPKAVCQYRSFAASTGCIDRQDIAQQCPRGGNASFYKWRSKYDGMNASMISQPCAVGWLRKLWRDAVSALRSTIVLGPMAEMVCNLQDFWRERDELSLQHA